MKIKVIDIKELYWKGFDVAPNGKSAYFKRNAIVVKNGLLTINKTNSEVIAKIIELAKEDLIKVER